MQLQEGGGGRVAGQAQRPSSQPATKAAAMAPHQTQLGVTATCGVTEGGVAEARGADVLGAAPLPGADSGASSVG